MNRMKPIPNMDRKQKIGCEIDCMNIMCAIGKFISTQRFLPTMALDV
jgi:hypothetical protein